MSFLQLTCCKSFFSGCIWKIHKPLSMRWAD